MAKQKEQQPALAIPPEFQHMSLEEMQRLIAATDLQAKILDLDRIQDDNQRRLAHKEAIERHNKQIQADVEAEQRNMKLAQSICRHRQGGRPQNVYAGDGKPCITRTQMLDGYTWLLQCLRCRMKIFTPHPSLRKAHPEEYTKLKAIYDKFWEMSEESGLDGIRGPSFLFERDGVPFIPERL
jgi:hypothetical protein